MDISHFFMIIKKKINKEPFTNYVYGNLKLVSLNYGTNYNAGLKQDFDVRVGS